MQTLVLEIASTFADDAMAFVKGAGRLVLHAITSPIERLARACDVADMLSQRTSRYHSANSRRPRRWLRCRSPFRSLNELT